MPQGQRAVGGGAVAVTPWGVGGGQGAGGRSTREGSSLIAPAHLGLEWSREAGRREAGAVAELICGGGAGAWEEVRLVVMAVAELGGGAGIPL